MNKVLVSEAMTIAVGSLLVAHGSGRARVAAGAQVCSEAAIQASKLELPSASFAGTYALTMVATPDTTSERKSVTGSVVLRVTARTQWTVAASDMAIPFHGWAEIDLRGLGDFPVAVPPASRDANAPGAQVIYDFRDSTVTLVLGNPMSASGVGIHAGVDLLVYQIDRNGFVGVWRRQGLGKARLAGYFCAERRPNRE